MFLMKFNYFLFSFSALSFLISCNGNPDYKAASPDNLTESALNVSEEIISPDEEMDHEQIERKLIKSGNIQFETSDMDKTRQQILDAVKKYNGYISADDLWHSEVQSRSNLTVRLPSKNFDAFVTDATANVTQFDNKQFNVQDVTEEFLDIEARLKTKKELESRYQDLLKKANSVQDILSIEEQIGKLRSDIESIEGRLNYLQNQVSYSTVTISFYKQFTEQHQFGYKLLQSFKNGWELFIDFIYGLINIWPFILLLIALIYGLIRIRKRRKMANNN